MSLKSLSAKITIEKSKDICGKVDPVALRPSRASVLPCLLTTAPSKVLQNKRGGIQDIAADSKTAPSLFSSAFCIYFVYPLPCSYLHGANDVIEETKFTAEDEYRQQAISFFDNKFGSIVPLKALYFVE